MLGIVLAVLILLVMITVHEFGHYLAGKLLKFNINEFSIGFGPALFKHRSKKTGEVFAVRSAATAPLRGRTGWKRRKRASRPKRGLPCPRESPSKR